MGMPNKYQSPQIAILVMTPPCAMTPGMMAEEQEDEVVRWRKSASLILPHNGWSLPGAKALEL